jgi:hypothetical protein
MSPATAPPLTTGALYLDDCGRYRVPEIAQPTGPFVALAIDDADLTKAGPSGTTNAVGFATPKGMNLATKDFEAFIVRAATYAGWTGGPSLAAGIYAPVYRGHRAGTDLATGVTFTFGPMASPPPTMTDASRDFYFTAGSTNRTSLDGNAGATTTNGTVLVSGANLGELYSGQGGGLPAECRWDIHAGAAIAGAVFIQIFRPTNAPGLSCLL